MMPAAEISSALLAAIRADALSDPGRERCGLLTGSPKRIDGFLPVRNISPTPCTRFELDPAALLGAHREARAGGPAIVGHYHAHPSGDPVPSPRDAAAAAGDGSLWLIVAPSGEALFRACAGGPIHDAFDPVILAVRSDVTPEPTLHRRERVAKRAVPNEDSPDR